MGASWKDGFCRGRTGPVRQGVRASETTGRRPARLEVERLLDRLGA